MASNKLCRERFWPSNIEMTNFWVLILLDCNPRNDSFVKVKDDDNLSSFISLVFCSKKFFIFILIKWHAIYGHHVNTDTLSISDPFSICINSVWLYIWLTLRAVKKFWSRWLSCQSKWPVQGYFIQKMPSIRKCQAE